VSRSLQTEQFWLPAGLGVELSTFVFIDLIALNFVLIVSKPNYTGIILPDFVYIFCL
jgi:hypothetical protein